MSSFNMFQERETGFTETFIKEVGKVFEEHVQQLRNALISDPGFDDMSTDDYEEKKEFMKKSVKEIGEYYFTLVKGHFHFINQQAKVVNDICGFEPKKDNERSPAFNEAFEYDTKMINVYAEFMRHYEKCLEEIKNMVTKENMTEVLYNEYKLSWIKHILEMNEQNITYIKLLFKQHRDIGGKVADLDEKMISLKSSINGDMEKGEGYYQTYLEKANKDKEKLNDLTKRISDILASETTVPSIKPYTKVLKSLKIMEKSGKLMRQSYTWNLGVQKNWDDFKEIYDLQIAITSLHLKCVMEDLEVIKNTYGVSLEQQKQQIVSINKKLHSLSIMYTKLLKEEQHTIEKMKNVEVDEEEEEEDEE